MNYWLMFALSVSVICNAIHLYNLLQALKRNDSLCTRIGMLEIRLLRLIQEKDGSNICYPKGTLDS